MSLVSDVCKDVVYRVIVCVGTSYHNNSSVPYSLENHGLLVKSGYQYNKEKSDQVKYSWRVHI
jgi:hypothetical protein